VYLIQAKAEFFTGEVYLLPGYRGTLFRPEYRVVGKVKTREIWELSVKVVVGCHL
jgi:hypothetical protein